MSTINSASQYNAFPIDTQDQISTLNNEDPKDTSNIQSSDSTNDSPSTKTTLSPQTNYSSIGSDFFAQTQRAKFLNFPTNGKQESLKNQSFLEPKAQDSPTNFSNSKVANENMFGQMMKASIQSKPISKIDSPSPSSVPNIDAVITFPNDGEPITAERASRRFVQEYVGEGDLFPDEVDKVQKLSDFSIKADDQTVQSQTQTVNGQRVLKVSINNEDKTKLLEAKKQVLGERETVEKIFQEVRSQNEIEGASKGLLTGVYDSGKQAYDLVAHPVDSATNLARIVASPIETTRQLKQAFGNKYDEFVAAPPSRKAEMLAYLPGQALGNILLGKGVGVIAKTTPVTKATSAVGKAIGETKLGQSAIKVADSVNNVKTVVKEEALKRVSIVLDAVVKNPKAVTSTITTIFDNKVPTTRIASEATRDSAEVIPNKVLTTKPVLEPVVDSTEVLSNNVTTNNKLPNTSKSPTLTSDSAEVLPDNVTTNNNPSSTSKSPTSVNSGYDPTKRTDIELQQDLDPSLKTGESSTQATKRVEAAQSEIMARRPYDQLQADRSSTLRPGETLTDAQKRVYQAESELLKRASSITQQLGETPRKIDLLKEDPVNHNINAHTIERHASSIPLQRDVSIKTIEGRLFGDAGWKRPESNSLKWKDDFTMNRTVNDYITQNWSQIKEDLALNGVHRGVFDTKKSVGEGFTNVSLNGSSPTSRYVQTSYVKIIIKLKSDNPAEFAVITTYPSVNLSPLK
ncbi:MAG: hypothetical protein HY819_15035 [Acidobacteria bacterium]|nr:hypothetical protein [Acidobacteriota bacterium]